MAIIQALLSAITRSAGKLLNTAFSWATVLLFGKVPEEKQVYLSAMSFGSIAWLVALLGVAFPSFGAFLLVLVPLPSWVDRGWVRLAMLIAALLIPPIVGLISLLILDPADQPRGAGAKARMVLKGYLFTIGLSFTLVILTVFAPIMKLRTILRRWTSQHVPVIVEPEDYMATVDEVERAVKAAGWKTRRSKTTWMLRMPTKMLTLFAGGTVKNLVADKLTTLTSDTLEITLHPSDLIVAGREEDVVHARAAIAVQLAFSKAYMTWSKEANEIEDKLEAIWGKMRAGSEGFATSSVASDLRKTERQLTKVEITYEEWEVLYRELLLVERGLLQVMAKLTGRPKEPSEAQLDEASLPTPRLALSVSRLLLLPAAAIAMVVIPLLLRKTGRTLG